MSTYRFITNERRSTTPSSAGTIDKAVLVGRLHDALAVSLEDLKAVVGAQDYAKIVPVPPQLASDYVFYKEKN